MRYIVFDGRGSSPPGSITFTHRSLDGCDFYFISYQENNFTKLRLSLRVSGREPELWDGVTGKINKAGLWSNENGRTVLTLYLDANASVFIVLKKRASLKRSPDILRSATKRSVQNLSGNWIVTFDAKNGGPVKPVVFDSLLDWSKHADPHIKYYSGTAVYAKTFSLQEIDGLKPVWLKFAEINNIATVKVNGINCGTIWTAPYEIDIRKAIRKGDNQLIIEVTNTWANRLIGDQWLPVNKRITWTTAPFRLKDKPLLPAGMIGSVRIIR